MTQQGRAYLYGMGAVLCWSTVATAFKLSLAHLSPAQLLLLAAITSSVLLAGILQIQGKLGQLKNLTRKNWLISLLFGAVNPFIYYLILLKAYDLLPAQEAQVLNYTWALTMSLLAVPLLGHRLCWQDMVAALLCYAGVLVIATRGDLLGFGFSNLTGVALALISTVLWALYWIFNARDQRDPVVGLFLNFLCALPMITLYCWFTDELVLLPWRGIIGAIYIGIFEMGLPFVMWLTAMKLTKSTAAISNLIFISPLLSLIFISLLLQETIFTSTLYGLVLIITGLLVQQFLFKRSGQS